jgi:hypothetical protein
VCPRLDTAGLASELDELRRQLRAANSALGNLGSLNPRHPGLHNDAIQLVKRLIARCLNWYTRPLRECLVAVVASLNEMGKVLEALTQQAQDREAIRRDLLERSQKRWKGSEPDASLTWGEIFTGDSFIDAVTAHNTQAAVAVPTLNRCGAILTARANAQRKIR